MTADYDPAAHGNNPALLLHLGDVIYGHQKAALYRDEFYRPYMKYPGKIIAIPETTMARRSRAPTRCR